MERELAEVLIGESNVMRNVRRLILQVAPARLPVLVQGPTGAGKELVAQALHSASGRPGRIVPFNVCAIPDSLFESALFGHVRGAFTGALHDSAGLLTEGHRGTVFLDEISALTVANQVKLLRVIERQEYRPLGAKVDSRSDFRIVTASNADLHSLANRGLFREDLVYRLSGVVINVPPLTHRPEDIKLLVERFRAESARQVGKEVQFAPDAHRLLEEHTWPGNVRELRLTIERAVWLANANCVGATELAAIIHQHECGAGRLAREQVAERREMLRLLDEEKWDTAALAARLGTHRATVYRWMRRLAIEPVAMRRLQTDQLNERRP